MTTREFTDTGRAFHAEQAAQDRHGRTAEVFEKAFVAEADDLTWHPVPDDGVIKGPMSPVLMLKEVIEQLELHGVVSVAYGGVLEYPDGPETATYSCLGVEVQTKRQHFRILLLDTGLGAMPVFIDWIEGEPE